MGFEAEYKIWNDSLQLCIRCSIVRQTSQTKTLHT